MLSSELKFAVRGLIGAPGLSAAAVVALALGIGPNTAIFFETFGILVLATLGIYAVMAFTVVQRTAEIGLRMALGAGHTQVRLQILREGATLATGGLVLGLVGAYALGRAMQALLFGTGALSVPVVLVAGLVLLVAALVACYVPARRASTVDPLSALRQS